MTITRKGGGIVGVFILVCGGVFFVWGFLFVCLFLGSFIYLQQIKELGFTFISSKGGLAIAAYDGDS